MAHVTQGRWSLDREAFDRLLRILGPDEEAAAREYETLRRRLIAFFDWRGAECPDDLADETMDRVARKLAEGERVDNVRAYFYGVARNVWKEGQKRLARERTIVADALPHRPGGDHSELSEARIACLERCVRELPEDARALIVAYYQGAGKAHLEERKALAERLGLTYGTLKTRAHRIRGRLEECLLSCLAAWHEGNH